MPTYHNENELLDAQDKELSSLLNKIQFVEPDVDQAYQRVLFRLKQNRRKMIYYRSSIAASVIVLLSVSIYLFFPLHVVPTEGIFIVVEGKEYNLAELKTNDTLKLYDYYIARESQTLFTCSGNKEIQIQNKTDHNYIFNLPNSSSLELQANASIIQQNTPRERMVKLIDGNALFHVSKNELPYLVECNEMKILVTGTIFIVEKQISSIAAILVDGSVNITANNQNITLKKGEQVVFEDDVLNEKTNIDLTSKLANWYQQQEFVEIRLAEIMDYVHELYGVSTIWHNDSFKEIKLSGIITRARNLNETLEILSNTLASQCQIVEQNGIVEIK